MEPEIEMLLNKIEQGSLEEKSGALLSIGDYIEYGRRDPEEFREVVQRQINAVANETDKKIQNALFRNISMAYQQKINLSAISFDPLIAVLDKSMPLFSCNVLYLLSMTCQQKYIPVIAGYVDHPDEKIKGEAESALEFLKQC